jgi:uncharacterized protein (TIGR02646 family)
MRRLNRLPLSQETLAFLQQRTDEVAKAGDMASRIEQLWKLQNNKAFQEVRRTLAEMASGIERCMYCEDSKGTAIDHFWPKADYPDRAFTWLNYMLACSECNSKKSKRFPLDPQGAPLLLNPVEEEPLDHLAFSPSTGKYETLTPRGEESQNVYGLDRSTLVMGRQVTWVVLKALLSSYSKHLAVGDAEEAEKQRNAVKQLQFSGVFAAFLRISQGPAARVLIGEECLQILENHPEIATWL